MIALNAYVDSLAFGEFSLERFEKKIADENVESFNVLKNGTKVFIFFDDNSRLVVNDERKVISISYI